MINGTEWLVVTKLDVLDSLAEIPVCTHYKIDGVETDVIPAGRAMDCRAVHPWKAVTPTLVTLPPLAKVMAVMAVRSLNAERPISVTVPPPRLEGTVMAPLGSVPAANPVMVVLLLSTV